MKRLILTTLAVFVVIGGLTTASASAATLTASPSSVDLGGQATVSWSGVTSPSPNDWVGIYTPGAADTAPTAAVYDSSCTLTAGSAGKASGSCSFPVPTSAPLGTYEWRLFSNNSYTKLATSNQFSIVSPATISVSPSTVTVGNNVTVSFSGVPGATSTDWIGVYTPGAADTAPLAYVYDNSCTTTAGSTAKASGSCTFPSGTIAASYEFRLFYNNSWTKLATSNTLTVSSGAQGMAVPAYFYPGPYWTQLDQAAPTLQLAVMNPNSGPGSSPDPQYVSAVRAAQAAGITVVGYVSTSYASRSLSAVESDVNSYYSWYGVNGIFFDQASTDCANSSYYATLNSFVKAKGGTARTILNPGTQTNQCYVPDADILLTFEGSDTQYVNSYSAPSWVASYPPTHFWHVIYGTSTASAMTQAVQLSKQRDAGFVYVTPDTLPNPWDTLPSGSYWTGELAAIG